MNKGLVWLAAATFAEIPSAVGFPLDGREFDPT